MNAPLRSEVGAFRREHTVGRAGEIDSWFRLGLSPAAVQEPADPAIHEQTTAVEIGDDTDGNVDVFVSGVSPCGTITGVVRYFKRKRAKPLLSVAVEVAASPVLTQRRAGVVIGATAVIGERVRLYQAVTLGAKSFATDESGHPLKGVPRHPIVEDDVVIYAGATILGRITIGRGSTIGGNVWLTRSVPPGSTISQAQVRHEAFEGGAGI